MCTPYPVTTTHLCCPTPLGHQSPIPINFPWGFSAPHPTFCQLYRLFTTYTTPMSTVAHMIRSLPSPGLLLPTHQFQGPPINVHQVFTQLPSTLCGLHYLCHLSALLQPGVTSTHAHTSVHCTPGAPLPILCRFSLAFWFTLLGPCYLHCMSAPYTNLLSITIGKTCSSMAGEPL